MQKQSLLLSCSSFRLESMHEPITLSFHNEEERKQKEAGETEANQDFEFAVPCRTDHRKITVSADEMFAKGQIRTIFPVFEQDLFSNHRTSSSSSRRTLGKLLSEESNPLSSCCFPELETRPGISCACVPKKEMSREKCKKNNSSQLWKRLKNLIGKSNSENEERRKMKDEKAVKKTSDVSKVKRSSSDGVADRKVLIRNLGSAQATKSGGHDIFCLRARALKEADRHRTFLPYKIEMFGFSAIVNELSGKVHQLN